MRSKNSWKFVLQPVWNRPAVRLQQQQLNVSLPNANRYHNSIFDYVCMSFFWFIFCVRLSYFSPFPFLFIYDDSPLAPVYSQSTLQSTSVHLQSTFCLKPLALFWPAAQPCCSFSVRCCNLQLESLRSMVSHFQRAHLPEPDLADCDAL